ncbi:MAG: hypothetical protein PF961_19495 [Planctomycetota bacterium]|jgi:hypothetical protein|nr:hypothetical protein [Planctomycetota bacterium]
MLRYCLPLMLLGCLGAAEGPEAISLEALRAVLLAAPDAASVDASLAERFGLAPAQRAALLALPLAGLSGWDDRALQGFLAASLAGDDAQLVEMASKRMSAGAGTSLPAAGGTGAGRMSGGVRFELDRVALQADAIDFTLAAVAGADSVLDTALIDGGTGLVQLDTRASRFASINFRGLLEPARIEITQRKMADDGLLVFDCVFVELGSFAGLLRGKDGSWQPVEGTGTALHAEVEAQLIDGRLAAPRFRAMRLLGDAEGPAQLALQERQQQVTVRSREVSLVFASDGRLERMDTGADTEVVGVPVASSQQVELVPEQP